MRRLAIAAAALLAGVLLAGHVGSPDVWFDGEAGPYPVRVIVRMPGAVPGLADVAVRVRGGGAERVLVTPARWDTGPEGAPPPDVATPVSGDPELFSAQLWLMTRGAYRIMVTVEGPEGSGTALVPVVATATERLGMSRATGIGLAGAGLFLFAGLLSLVGAAVRESVLPPGEEPDRRRRRRARYATAGAAVVTAALLFGGWTWWSAVDEAHRARLDRPWASEASVRVGPDGARVLELEITDSLWVRRNDPSLGGGPARPIRTPLIPDHGKLMHMFMVREPDLAGFAHLHPVSRDSVRFEATLPPLPAGRYTVYADIVQESGTSHTLVAELELPEPAAGGEGAGPPGGVAVVAADGAETGEGGVAGVTGVADVDGPATAEPGPAPDPDDSWWTGRPHDSLAARYYRFDDGPTLRWRVEGRLAAGEEVELVAELTDAEGRPAPIQPYMGMAGHAAVRRDDGSVFVHLHPTGTISMAAQAALARREGEGRRAGAGEAERSGAGAAPSHDSHAAADRMPVARGRVAFPYAFPRSGRYRVWVQLLHAGHVRTAAWDVEVEG